MSSRVTAQPSVVACELADGSALLDSRSNVYYGLNATGSLVWEFIQQPRSVAEIRDHVVAAYEVAPAACADDLLVLLRQLADAGLVEVRHGEPS